MKVYIADITQLEDDMLFSHLYKSVSEERRKKVDRRRFFKDKCLSLGVGMLLETALLNEGVDDFTITTEHNAKPCLLNRNDIHFNLSHSGAKVMCAVSNCDVGCDVEQITDANIKIAHRYFYINEYETLMKCQDKNIRNNLFFRYWTLKESFIKATGLGFKLPFNKFYLTFESERISVNQNVDERTYFFKELDLNDGYKYAVCKADKPINAEIIKIIF